MPVARLRRLPAINLLRSLCLLLLSFNALSAEPDYTEEDHILLGIDAVYDSGPVSYTHLTLPTNREV